MDSRVGAGGLTRRRYVCECGVRFTTAEFLVFVGNGNQHDSRCSNIESALFAERDKRLKRDIVKTLLAVLEGAP